MYPQSCLSFSMHSLLYMTQQFLVGTSKVKRNCSYTCQQSAHMRAWEQGYNLPLICLHFLLLIGFYFSKVHDESSALRNLCCASVILSIHTHPWPLHPWLNNIFFMMYSLVKYIHYLSTVCTYCLPCTFPTLAFSQC